MPRLSKEQKEEIQKKLSEGATVNDISTEYSISKKTVYNIRKAFQSPEKTTSEDTKNESETTREEDITSTEEEEDITSKTSRTNSLDKELHVSTSTSNTSRTNSLDEELHGAPSVKSFHSVKKQKIEVVIPEKKEFIPPKNIPSVDTTDKKRRDTIIKIRQYIRYFSDKLQSVYGSDKENFLKSVFYKTDSELDIILEEIQITLSTNQCLPLMMKIFESIISVIEGLFCSFGLNLKGLQDDVKNDEQFRECLTMLACEYVIDLEPKKKLIFLTVRAAFLRYQLNSAEKIEIREVPKEEVTKLKEQYNKL